MMRPVKSRDISEKQLNWKGKASFYGRASLYCISTLFFFLHFPEFFTPPKQLTKASLKLLVSDQMNLIQFAFVSLTLRLSLSDVHSYTLIQSLNCLWSNNRCDCNSINMINLKRHQSSQHAGIQYGCNDCDHKATTLESLKRHKSSQHDGIKYDCNHCDYKATTKSNLKTHTDSQHATLLT